MELSGRLRMIFGLLAGVALIAVAVLAVQGGAPSTTAIATIDQDNAAVPATNAEHTTCTGDCATCPNAQSHPCPPESGAADDEPSETASVDTDRCIGCVRCVNVSPEAFRMDPETRKAEVIAGADPDAIARGAQACPVDAISME